MYWKTLYNLFFSIRCDDHIKLYEENTCRQLLDTNYEIVLMGRNLVYIPFKMRPKGVFYTEFTGATFDEISPRYVELHMERSSIILEFNRVRVIGQPDITWKGKNWKPRIADNILRLEDSLRAVLENNPNATVTDFDIEGFGSAPDDEHEFSFGDDDGDDDYASAPSGSLLKYIHNSGSIVDLPETEMSSDQHMIINNIDEIHRPPPDNTIIINQTLSPGCTIIIEYRSAKDETETLPPLARSRSFRKTFPTSKESTPKDNSPRSFLSRSPGKVSTTLDSPLKEPPNQISSLRKLSMVVRSASAFKRRTPVDPADNFPL